MSEFWQWLFAILGLVAFIMAFPFVLQLLFGQPKIGYTFGHDDTGSEGRIIQMHLMNPPINNSFLKMLKVSRIAAQDVYLRVEVREDLTRQIIGHKFAPDIKMSSSNIGVRVGMPPSILMANVTLVKWQRSTNSALLLCGTQPIPLPTGKYTMRIQMGLDGRVLNLKQFGLLNVGDTENDLRWDERITKNFFY